MPAYFPELDVPQPFDTEVRSLQKIVSLGGGGGGGGDVQVYTGASPPAAPDNAALPAIFYPSGGGTIQQWDVGTAAWI